MMVHKEIYETGMSNWYDQEGVEKYQEHFKNITNCKKTAILNKVQRDVQEKKWKFKTTNVCKVLQIHYMNLKMNQYMIGLQKV